MRKSFTNRGHPRGIPCVSLSKLGEIKRRDFDLQSDRRMVELLGRTLITRDSRFSSGMTREALVRKSIDSVTVSQ